MRLIAACVAPVLLLACSAAQELPASDLRRAMCALEAVRALPRDPEQATAEDAKDVARRYLNCEAPDGGVR